MTTEHQSSAGVEFRSDLGSMMTSLSTRLDDEVGRCAPLLSGGRSAEQLLRLARYRALIRWGRMACAGSLSVAACLAIVLGTLFITGPSKASRGGGGPQAQLALAGGHVSATRDADLKESPAVAAIPVHGWIEFPSKDVSPDSSIWWVVLTYGGPQ
jgi:hypothetical protein